MLLLLYYSVSLVIYYIRLLIVFINIFCLTASINVYVFPYCSCMLQIQRVQNNSTELKMEAVVVSRMKFLRSDCIIPKLVSLYLSHFVHMLVKYLTARLFCFCWYHVIQYSLLT